MSKEYSKGTDEQCENQKKNVDSVRVLRTNSEADALAQKCGYDSTRTPAMCARPVIVFKGSRVEEL